MTTDPFTEVARAEADKRMREADFVTSGDMVRAHGFTLGAEWARAHLAAQEPTDYQIDVAMDAYAEASGQSVSRPWMEAAINAYESAARRDERGPRDD